MRYFLIILSFIFAMVACQSNTTIQEELSQAEAYLQKTPDRALHILEQVDPSRIWRNSIRARYALLYSMALDKNYIFVESDSLIRIARDFYRHSNDLRSRYLSKFYYGLVLHNQKENVEALINYLEAESDALRLEDPYLLGMLYNEISDIYKSQYDYPNSLKYAQKSFKNYHLAGKNHHSSYALYNIGKAYAELEQPDSAERYLLASLDISESLRDTAMASYTLANLAITYIADDKPEATIAALWIIRRQWHTDWSYSEYTFMATAYRMMNRLDSALYYLGYAKIKAPSDPQSQAQLNITAAPIHMKTGAYRQAAEEYRHSAQVQDSLVRISLRQSYANLHRDYIEEQQHATSNALYIARQKLGLMAALVVIIILFIGYVAYASRRKRQQMEVQYMTAIDDVQQANQILLLRLERQKRADTKGMRHLIKDRFGIVNELAATYYECKGANEQKAIFNKVKTILDTYASSEAGKQEIEELVNACYNDVMAKVRQELPLLKGPELDLLRYIYAGFSLRVISLFTGDSINYTAVKKSRLKAKIAASDVPSKELFINLMS